MYDRRCRRIDLECQERRLHYYGGIDKVGFGNLQFCKQLDMGKRDDGVMVLVVVLWFVAMAGEVTGAV
jgi:hypothetical protein